MQENNTAKITPEMAKTLPGVHVLKIDGTHYNISFQNNPSPEDVIRMASTILIASSRNQEWRERACTEFARTLPALLKNMGIQSSADQKLKEQQKAIESLSSSVKSYGGNPDKILRNAGLE